MLGWRRTATHELRQEDEYEQNGSEQHKGGKKAEILHGAGIEPEQTEEGRHGGEIADKQRQYHLAKRLATVADFLVLIQKVQRIVRHNADDDRADTQYDNRDSPSENKDSSQREECPEKYRGSHPENVGQATIMQQQYQEYQYDSNSHRVNGIPFDLCGVGGSNQRGTHGSNLHARNLTLDGRHAFAQEYRQLAIVIALICPERTVKGDDTVLPIGGKKVAVHHLESVIEFQGIQSLKARSEQLQRIHGKRMHDRTRNREHQQLFVLRQPLLN